MDVSAAEVDGATKLVAPAGLLAAYGTRTGAPEYNHAADFSLDDCVDLHDLGVLLEHYGVVP